MDILFEIEDRDVLRGWAEAPGRGRRRRSARPVTGLRFAFYGRTSTAEFQDPVTSRAVAAGDGRVGDRRAWDDHLRVFRSRVFASGAVGAAAAAAALLEQAQGTNRGFDAVVVGEFERAFTDRQFHEVGALLARHGVAVWLPETGGPVDLADPDHRVLMQVLAAQSQREVVRSRHRTLAAMTAQAVEQGRFLGGRPPYWYRLVDAGPHPNRAHAAWGRRRQRLDPDPVTARYVRWIFTERLAGRSVARIARELNERDVPCPSAADPGWNRHRSGQVWNLRSVAVILANPRYTGREVWRRNQRATPGRGRPVIPAEWAISAELAHPALVAEADFVAVQQIRAARVNDDGVARRYRLAGLLRCGLCGRLMDAHWVNGRAGYCCRHGHNSARPASTGRPRNLYVREDKLVVELAQGLKVDGDNCASRVSRVVAHLRSRNMVVVHGRTGWRVTACDDV